MSNTATAPLRRDLGVWGAMMMGLGSILGTGVFVSLGIGAEVAGTGVLPALALAALVATCNGLSSAQLAANHPISGGTYEYGYRWLTPLLGFVAGWMFLCAKSASAATAALGFAGYLLHAASLERDAWLLPVSLLTLAVLTAVVLSGIRRTSALNMVIVSITLATLAFFVVAGSPTALARLGRNWLPPLGPGQSAVDLLQATALMFVAYTGYGRIATLGEEVRQPRLTIPRAVVVTLLVAMVVYLGVAFVGLASVGAEAYGAATREQVAPLEVIAGEFGVPGAAGVMAVGAMTAMLGVLLNLLLGLSRVVLAMGRRRDLPAATAAVNSATGVPWVATILVAAIIGGLVLLGDVRLTWSFSAFTVLVYYALTNLSALRLPSDQRLFPRWTAWAGLLSCTFLAGWVEREIWLAGIGLIAVGIAWHLAAQQLARQAARASAGRRDAADRS